MAIVFIGVVFSYASRYLPGNRFLGATSIGPEDSGAGGNSLGGRVCGGDTMKTVEQTAKGGSKRFIGISSYHPYFR
jgi:hypothetical protein